jgi:transcriptional regulator with XRE-family HTH domain
MSIGETLAAARAAAGLTVEDVSRETRVRGTLVRAIEADDFEPCGGTVYARGHIRNIAHLLGIDPAPLIGEFDRAHGAPAPAEQPAPAFDPEVVAAERRRPNWPAAMAVALSAICVVAVVQLVTHGGGHPARQPQATGTHRHLQPTPQPSVSPAPAPTGAVALVPQNRVNVRVRIVGDKSWLQVVGASGAVLFENTLATGTQRDFTDSRNIRMTIGNAGAVDLIVNGRDLGLAGGSGAVVHKSFGRGNPTSTAG